MNKPTSKTFARPAAIDVYKLRERLSYLFLYIMEMSSVREQKSILVKLYRLQFSTHDPHRPSLAQFVGDSLKALRQFSEKCSRENDEDIRQHLARGFKLVPDGTFEPNGQPRYALAEPGTRAHAAA